MYRGKALVLYLIGFALTGVELNAQSYEQVAPDYFSTSNTDFKSRSKKKGVEKRKNIDHIYKNSSEGTLYGNACATEATQSMGFVYVLQVEGLPGSTNEKQQFYNNLWVNIKLIFRKSPFWKMILNKRIRECREKSGDIVG